MQQNFDLKEVEVKAKSKTYSVLIGKEASKQLVKILKSLKTYPGTILIVTDDLVADLYLSEVRELLEPEFRVTSYILKNGESAKSFEEYYKIQTFALEKGLDRNSIVLALGGGVVGDIAGFVAATFMRGIRFIQMPTTLLAHDSAVGGKVAINHPLGKNMIGSFYQPESVIYDTDFLVSLPEMELRSGFAEVVKHALIWDKEFFYWIVQNIPTISALDEEKLRYCIEKGISTKAEVVSNDEIEIGMRAILNFGHTLGHAIEAAYGYGNITHGDAVALGMLFATEISEDLSPKLNLSNELRELWQRFGFPTSIRSDILPENILNWMKKDKKTKNGHIHMVLIRSVGSVIVESVPDELVLKKIKAFY
ncbi:3-dehydroquinate synthase [Sutcliffiella deserti]|uniref:3-dehydroquinate synthase n=1 Tax=Sutcliffiella deserti TaxID=2875501 RepID=UPI001CBB9355|nr:3-dehydroquinate synthase [Sutcliffiella deserti]